MEYRAIKSNDYKKLEQWWKWWRWTPVPVNCLPATGIIISENEIDVCAGFMYGTDSAMCWIEFIVSNPDVKDKNIRKSCIEFLISKLCEEASELGYQVAYTSLKNESLINSYSTNGFTKGSVNCTEMIKVL